MWARGSGVSFRSTVLEPAFGDRLLYDYADRPIATGRAERNAHAAAYVPSDDLLARYDCVHGHFPATKYVCDKAPCEFSVWLRHPVQRVASRFFYGKRTGDEATKDLTFSQFCRLERFHNLYAQYLWNFDVERFDFVGVIEDYARSMAVFCRRFGISQEITGAAASDVNPDKNARQTYDVAPVLREFIERTNAQDLEIYEWGKCHLSDLERRL